MQKKERKKGQAIKGTRLHSFIFMVALRSDNFDEKRLCKGCVGGGEWTNKIHHRGKWSNACLTSYIREPSKAYWFG